KDAEWQSDRAEDQKPTLKSRIKAALKKKDPRSPRLRRAGDGEAESDARHNATDFSKALAKLPKGKPRFIEPTKPRLMDDPPTGGDWSYELKFDGIRACAIKDG